MIGVDTVGRSRARNEYGAIVVFAGLFCDQSMNTFPGRCAFAIVDTTSFGCSCANRCATAFAYSDVSFAGAYAYTCMPLLPDVFAHESTPSSSSTIRTCSATRQHSTIVAGAPGSRSNTSRSGSRLPPRGPTVHCGTCNSSAARFASHTNVASSSTIT